MCCNEEARLLHASRENLVSGRILRRRKSVAPLSGVAALALGRDVAWDCSVRHRGAQASGVLQRGEAVCSYIKSSPQTLLVSMWISMALLMLVPNFSALLCGCSRSLLTLRSDWKISNLYFLWQSTEESAVTIPLSVLG